MRGWVLGVVLVVLLAFVGWFTVLPWLSVRMAAGRPGTYAPPVLDPRQTFLIVYDSGRSPVRGATVTFRRDDRTEPVAVVITGMKPGLTVFRLPDEESSWAGLRVRAEIGALSREVLLEGHPGECLEFNLSATLPLKGRVVRKGTGIPVAGARVRTGVGTVSADEDGKFQVAFQPSRQFLDGSLNLEVVGEGGRAQPFHFPCTAAAGDLLLQVE